MADACLRGTPVSVIRSAGRLREEAATKKGNIAAIRMTSILIASVVIGSVLLTIARPALCADLVGRVLSSRGQAVSGVTVTVVNEKDVDAGKAVSDANGAYAISNLSPGAYKLNIVPGQWVMSYIGDKGLTVNWGLAPHSPPIAVATLGTEVDNSATSSAARSKISNAQSQPETAGRVQGTTY